MQRAEIIPTNYSGLGAACLAASPLGVDVHECVQHGIQSLDFCEMGFDQFDWRNLPAADLLRHDHGGKKGEITHAIESLRQKAESSMPCGMQKHKH